MKLWLCICIIVGAATWVGGAQAQLIEGTNGGDVLVGTDNADKMYGYGGADTIKGKGGNDLLSGGDGPDTIECGNGFDSPLAGDGEDIIFCDQADGKPDVISCGRNEDIVFWRVAGTVISSNCENAYRVTRTGDAVFKADVIDCGPGDDRIVGGARDMVVAANCEARESWSEWVAADVEAAQWQQVGLILRELFAAYDAQMEE